MENTGAEYPTIELGGTIYEVKFTRGLMYRLDKAGIQFAPKLSRTGGVVNSECSISTLMDTLHMAIGFPGTIDELVELAFDKRDEILSILMDGWGKVVLPSLKSRAVARAARKTTATETMPDKAPALQ
jgi:hypothetical protein